MVAKMLEALGLPMGSDGEAVHEDKEFGSALRFFYHKSRIDLIEQRNAQWMKWGFKFPSLQAHMFPAELEHFRLPRLIVVSRDTTAVACRACLSDPELKEPIHALTNIIKQQIDMVHFALKAPCPVLLLSYEKVLQSPLFYANALAAFCGLKYSNVDAATAAVQANNTDYQKLFA